MTVSVLLVLGEKTKNIVDSQTQEAWYMAYLDLLDHFELWTVSALVIKLSPLASINSLSEMGTTVIVGCGRCEKITGKYGWMCDHCYKLTPGCSICRNPVRGLWSWCAVCGHGGHTQHLSQWFAKFQFCPVGCGHKCEIEQFLK